ncbi:FAD-dependent monooxygenase [Chitinophaga qingshengii]|uniref:FAD-dependent monooxygenase n=1 Tax=Chitinophaga qingshengii TaxID=1569794 RepID=A0ABR7TU04_9BACT|nr:FAD-dependent monooxygenase [Chitinophaga qingshengii]MBC9933130.1 FAD-dependent monooxygenase [Chitinophaga qingshengii]
MKTTNDVIISGAGPVGLFLACELALAGCSVLVLEKAEHPLSPLKQLPFGIRGLSSPTIDAFYRRGLLDELEVPKRLKDPHAGAVKGTRRQVGHFAGIPFHEGDVDTSRWQNRLPGSPDTHVIAEMAELEMVLARRAEALGVVIKRGMPVSDFIADADKVVVHTGGQSFTSQWLVGCDGARSIVRKNGGFEFAGTEPAFTGYSTRMDIADPEKLRPGRNITERGMYLQSQPGYVMIQDFDKGAFHQSEKPLTREHVQEVLRRISGTDVTIETLQVATTWTDRSRQATAYRKGRVLLAGDAAHIHSPLGGQGLNLGLGDAMNLGWKLAATIHNKAPEGLLDTYHTERYPIGAQVLDWSRAQVAIMSPDPHARALQAIIRDLINTPDGATYMAARVWGIFTHYDTEAAHPLVGYSVPNFTLENGTDVGALMQDGRGLLLDFDRQAVLENFTKAYDNQIRYVAGDVKERMGVSAVLVRPDGIVAWAADNAADSAELRQAAARWFAGNTPGGNVFQPAV